MTFPDYWATKNPAEELRGGVWMNQNLIDLRNQTVARGQTSEARIDIESLFKIAAGFDSWGKDCQLGDDEAGLAVALLTMEMVRQGLDSEHTIPYSVAHRVLAQLSELKRVFDHIPNDKEVLFQPSKDETSLKIGEISSRFDNDVNLDQMKDVENVNITHYVSQMLYGDKYDDQDVASFRAFKALKILTVASSAFNSLGVSSAPAGADKPLDAQTLLEGTGKKLKRDYPAFWK